MASLTNHLCYDKIVEDIIVTFCGKRKYILLVYGQIYTSYVKKTLWMTSWNVNTVCPNAVLNK
jgi:hypothetical protein